MEKREELNLFLEKVEELIDSKYILADIKIVNILKVIASLAAIALAKPVGKLSFAEVAICLAIWI